MAERIDENGSTVEEGVLFAESIYGAKTRQGLVKLSYGLSFEVIIAPEDARAFALSVLEAAEAAEVDGLLMEWIESVGIKDDLQKVAVLRDFRQMREKTRRGE